MPMSGCHQTLTIPSSSPPLTASFPFWGGDSVTGLNLHRRCLPLLSQKKVINDSITSGNGSGIFSSFPPPYYFIFPPLRHSPSAEIKEFLSSFFLKKKLKELEGRGATWEEHEDINFGFFSTKVGEEKDSYFQESTGDSCAWTCSTVKLWQVRSKMLSGIQHCIVSMHLILCILHLGNFTSTLKKVTTTYSNVPLHWNWGNVLVEYFKMKDEVKKGEEEEEEEEEERTNVIEDVCLHA